MHTDRKRDVKMRWRIKMLQNNPKSLLKSWKYGLGWALVAVGNLLFMACPSATQTQTLVTPPKISTVAGTGTGSFSGDTGPATSATLFHPSGVAVDRSGNLYIADTQNGAIREVSGGTITTVAGVGGTNNYNGDGPATTHYLWQPYGVAVDSSGNIYIADRDNFLVREVTSGTLTTVAGSTGEEGLYIGDGASATSAGLSDPQSVAVYSAGNLYYIADTYNNAIRKVSGGIITTVASTGATAGNGPATAGYLGNNVSATSAELNTPFGVAVDSSGNFYIADSLNNVVRKVSGGTITTVAGQAPTSGSAAPAGYSGDNGPATSATLNDPDGVAVDSSGNIYIADTGNNVIRKVSTNGIITTVAGNGTAGYTGDGGVATLAELNAPYGVAVDSSGTLYIADRDNNVVRMVK